MRNFKISNHPWVSLAVILLLMPLFLILGIILSINILHLSPGSIPASFITPMTMHILLIFITIPCVLHLPCGQKNYRQYLDNIRLTQIRPFGWLLLLALTCYLILLLSQAMGSFVYKIISGGNIDFLFLQSVFDLSGDLPPRSFGFIQSFPSVFEEVLMRGVVLTLFLRFYSHKKAILISSLAFSLPHLMSVTNQGIPIPPDFQVWILGQIIWSFITGIFYGYVFIKSHSLLPSMIIHFLGNLFIGSLTSIQQAAPVETQVLFNLLFNLGIIPTSLMILWVRFFTNKYPKTNLKNNL